VALAFGLVTLGTMLVYSGLKGLTFVDILAGETGEPLDPKGGDGSPTGGGLAGSVANSVRGAISAGMTGKGFSGPKAKLLEHLSTVAVEKFNLTVTSTKRSGPAGASWHNRGRAADVAGKPADMMAFAKYAKGYLSELEELFYDPLGGWDGGTSIGAIGGHDDHVHFAA
jgi:hypothetical protein